MAEESSHSREWFEKRLVLLTAIMLFITLAAAAAIVLMGLIFYYNLKASADAQIMNSNSSNQTVVCMPDNPELNQNCPTDETDTTVPDATTPDTTTTPTE